MKIKSKFLTSAVVLGLALPAAFPLVANAADTAATGAGTASVDVKGGDLTIAKDGNGNLEAPSFAFKANVSETAQNNLPDQKISDTDMSKYTGSTLAVDDETGTGDGWNVTAKLSDLTLDTKTLAGAAMSVPAKTVGSDTTTATTLTAGGDPITVFSAAKDTGTGTSTADLGSATMSLPSVAYAGNYTGTITYTLTPKLGDTTN